MVGTTNARDPVAARPRRELRVAAATPTGASIAAHDTCELVRAYKDAKLACEVWGTKGGEGPREF